SGGGGCGARRRSRSSARPDAWASSASSYGRAGRGRPARCSRRPQRSVLLVAGQKGGAAAAAPVGQGGGPVGIVAVDPAQHGLVVPPDVQGAGGGVELPGGDQVQGLEALAGAGMGGPKRGAAQIFQALAPFAHPHAAHNIPPLRLLVWAIPPDSVAAAHKSEPPGLDLIAV